MANPSGLTEFWHKSTASDVGSCVEARILNDSVQVRNSREPFGPILSFTFEEWRAFLEGATRGEFALDDDSGV